MFLKLLPADKETLPADRISFIIKIKLLYELYSKVLCNLLLFTLHMFYIILTY